MTRADHGIFVVDASVFVDAVTEARWAKASQAFFVKYGDASRFRFVTVSYAIVEAANALRKYVRSSYLGDLDGLRSLIWLRGLISEFDDSSSRLERIWQLKHRMTAYDAAYAAAAEARSAPLITSDSKLLRACLAEDIEAIHLKEFES